MTSAANARSSVLLLPEQQSAEWQGLCPGSDHARPCNRLMRFLEIAAPEWLFVLPGFCKHRATGLCIAHWQNLWMSCVQPFALQRCYTTATFSMPSSKPSLTSCLQSTSGLRMKISHMSIYIVKHLLKTF